MEFTEVVSPHVALPVLGVLLCAFLVFAFGFKSPVQPPSFNFDDDTKKKKAKKPKTKVQPSNGHVSVSTSNTEPATPPKAVSNEKETKAVNAAKTAKKTATQAQPKKQSKKNEEAVPKNTVVMEAEHDDGWTTMSRKGKKLKGKKEAGDQSPVHSDGEKKEEVKVQMDAAAGQSQTPKDKRKKKNLKQDSEDKPVALETKTEEKPLAKETEHSKAENTGKVTGTAAVLSESAKNKKNKKSSKEAEIPKKASVEAPMEPKAEKPSEKALDTGKASAQKDKVVNAPAAAKTPDENKSTNEGQASKKQKKKESPKHSSDMPVSGDAASPKEDSSSPSNQEETKSSGVAPISFDEIGKESWIEAKPKSKKKKVRRDN